MSVTGQTIRNAEGKPVVLRGFNLGNWLVNEIWMMPITSLEAPAGYKGSTRAIADHVTFWQVIEERFSTAGRQRLQDAWRDAWLQESDVALMKAAGFNHVRLPFIADNLVGEGADAADVDPASLTDDSLDWRRIDQALGWAAKHELYVVLDMHGAPGRQSIEHHTGRRDVNRLWTDDNSQRVAERLWELIVAHVKGNTTVAAVDLLNEPRALPSEQEDANAAKIHAMHDRLYQAVRRADPARLVVIEDGFSGFNRMPQPSEKNWKQVIYSYHAYPENVERLRHTLGDWEYNDGQQRGVPFYIGEWSLAMHPDSFQWPRDHVSAIAEMDAKGISWCAWNFKVTPGNPDWRGTHWGWYRNEGPIELLDPWHDDLDTLVRKTAAVRTANLQVDAAWGSITAPR